MSIRVESCPKNCIDSWALLPLKEARVQGDFALRRIAVESKGLGRNGGQRQGFPV